jgi:DUF1680 family protein
LPDGRHVTLIQRTSYPWDGVIDIDVFGDGEFSLFLRIPAWAGDSANVRVKGESMTGGVSDSGYLEIRRHWSTGDGLRLELQMSVEYVRSHPYVLENNGRAAVMRGPIIYCAEQCDNPGVDLRDVELAASSGATDSYCPDQLGGVTTLQLQAAKAAMHSSEQARFELTLSPYIAWANRDPGRMQMWLRTS